MYVGFDDIAVAVPPTGSLFLACQSYPSYGNGPLVSLVRVATILVRLAPSSSDARILHTSVRSSISLDPFLFLPRVNIALSSSLTITSLSLVDPLRLPPSRGLLSWQPGYAHTHTHTRTRVAPGRSVSRGFGFDTLERARRAIY